MKRTPGQIIKYFREQEKEHGWCHTEFEIEELAEIIGCLPIDLEKFENGEGDLKEETLTYFLT